MYGKFSIVLPLLRKKNLFRITSQIKNDFSMIFIKQNKYSHRLMFSALKANHQYNLITNILPTSSKYADIQ